jgi:hypothetical protein
MIAPYSEPHAVTHLGIAHQENERSGVPWPRRAP